MGREVEGWKTEVEKDIKDEWKERWQTWREWAEGALEGSAGAARKWVKPKGEVAVKLREGKDGVRAWSPVRELEAQVEK